MFFPSKYPVGEWDTSALGVRPSEHAFVTDDGVRLHAWFFTAGEKAPALVWFHGNGGNLTDRAEMAAELARRGVSVFLFDWRGYGKSEGRPTENGLFRDSLAAWDTAAKLAPDAAMCGYGESLGGPYAAYVATKRKVACVVIENSFPSLRALGNALYSPIPLGWAAPAALPTARWLNAAQVPVLVMHGKRDQVISYQLGVALYDALNVPQKKMLSSELAGHCEIPIAEAERYYGTVVSFVKGER